MKKYSWIVALVLALSLGLIGCGGDEDEPDPNLPEVEIEAADITVEKIGSTSGQEASGNTYKLNAANATSAGFLINFPEDVKGKSYWKIGVEVELVAITSPDFISFNAKTSTQMNTDVLVFGHTQQYHGELKIGTIVDKDVGSACSGDCLKYTAGICIVGAKGYAEYPFNKFNDLIAFQYNPWAGDITTAGWSSSSGTANFEIKVTKVVFIPAEGEIAKLAAPVIELDGTTGIKWTAVEGATGYDVYADGTKVGSTLAADATSVDLLSMAALANREAPYSITLVAVGNPGISEDSDPSNAVSFDKSAAPPLYNVPAGGIDLGPITPDNNPYWEADAADVTTKDYLYVVFSQKPSGGGNFVWQDTDDKDSGYGGWNNNPGQGVFGDNGAIAAGMDAFASFAAGSEDKILKIDLSVILSGKTPKTYIKLIFQYYGGGEVIGGYLAD